MNNVMPVSPATPAVRPSAVSAPPLSAIASEPAIAAESGTSTLVTLSKEGLDRYRSDADDGGTAAALGTGQILTYDHLRVFAPTSVPHLGHGDLGFLLAYLIIALAAEQAYHRQH